MRRLRPIRRRTSSSARGYADRQPDCARAEGSLPITGGTMTGALNAPVIDGKACGLRALSSSVANCVATAASALIPPATSGSYTQSAAMNAVTVIRVQVYDPTHGGAVTGVGSWTAGAGVYVTAPAVSISSSTTGTGLAVTAHVTGGQVTSYTGDQRRVGVYERARLADHGGCAAACCRRPSRCSTRGGA